MVNEQVIERLRLKNWYVTSQNKQETSLVLQACDDAGITWTDGEKATELWFPFKKYPLYIGFLNDENGITRSNYNLYEKCELENITDWFFNAIKNNDNKLIPQNAEQEHLVQMLLAKLQGIPVERWSFSDQKWIDSANDTIITCNKYRLKPELTLTPLPIPRELWSYIHKEWQYVAMDEDGRIFFYRHRPTKDFNYWSSSAYMSECALNINTDGIDWQLSLTERPKDV